MAHLPFATLSSITEPLILLSRANPTDSGNVLKDIGSSLIKEGEDVVDRTVKFLIRASGGKTKGIKSLDDEVWQELHKTGLGLEQAVQERLEGLAGEGLYSSKAKLGQELFFKANVLTQWTKAVQLASFTTGKRLIQQNAQQLATGKTLAGRTISKKNREYFNTFANAVSSNFQGYGLKTPDIRTRKDGMKSFENVLSSFSISSTVRCEKLCSVLITPF